MNKTLQAFYDAYLEWLEAGAPEDNQFEFCRDAGLCFNLGQFVTNLPENVQLEGFPNSQMTTQFVDAGLHYGYPFSFSKEYEKECYSETCYLNPARVQWVKDHSSRNKETSQ